MLRFDYGARRGLLVSFGSCRFLKSLREVFIQSLLYNGHFYNFLSGISVQHAGGADMDNPEVTAIRDAPYRILYHLTTHGTWEVNQ